MPTLREFCTRLRFFMVTPAGPLAMISCEPRQARKGATVAVTSCAGVWLAGEATSLFSNMTIHKIRRRFASRACFFDEK